jgi:hypothetical protein
MKSANRRGGIPYADDHAGACLAVAPEAALGEKKRPPSPGRSCGPSWRWSYRCGCIRLTACWRWSRGYSSGITRRIERIERGGKTTESAIEVRVFSTHSILKFFQVDSAGMLRMTSSARYFKEGVGSSRPNCRWIICFLERPKANTSCRALVKCCRRLCESSDDTKPSMTSIRHSTCTFSLVTCDRKTTILRR